MSELTSRQKRKLRQTGRAMRLALAVSFIIFMLFAGFGLLARMAAISYLYIILLIAALTFDIVIRRALRCPNCAAPFGMRAYLELPPRCLSCGVSFR